MTKNQKFEWVLTGLMLISFPIWMIVALDNLDLFGSKPASASEIICGISLLALCGVFVINYLIKTILAFVRKTDGKLVPIIWILAPIACSVLTAVFANGIWTFNKEFVVFNVLSVVFPAIEILILNIYYAVFYGRNKVMIFSLIIYNALVWGRILIGGGAFRISFVHNIYLGFFIPAVFIGYIELAIRNRISNDK